MIGPNFDKEQYAIVSYNGLALLDITREDEDGYDYEMDVEWLQYVGHRDINGKEIYEGYITRNKRGAIGVVRFHNYWGGFYFATVFGHDEDGELVRSTSSVPMWNEWGTLEVIGNIYENRELMEVGK
ncbi:hypothetical protein ADS79_26910 [Brevibacillus reuszeri]|nr:hypothetical protein ADS79_26910 [Brevibacillus reuszeri]